MSQIIPPPVEPHGAARVDMLGLSKRFGALQALDDVSLTVQAGEFHALLGENGAGKSTLVKCLIGFYTPDRGSVMVDGREQALLSPRDAARLGLGMIFQHFTVAPGMSVAENLVLADRGLGAWIDWRRERERLAAFMAGAPFPLPLDSAVAELSAGEKQKLEILKQLYTRRRFLILDEPTSVLTPGEADEVLGRLRDMTRAGQLSVLMITHKFREVFACCDAVTVLRRGRHAGQARVADTSRDELARWMMGEGAATGAATVPAEPVASGLPVPSATPATPAASNAPAPSAPRLRIEQLRVLGADGRPAVDGLSLQVQPGEILGVAGVSGNGQRELMAALTGVLPLAGGSLSVDGQPWRPGRAATQALGLAAIPEEPLHNACVGRLSVAENLALRNFDRAPIRGLLGRLSHRAMRAQAVERIAALRVRTQGPAAPIESLSGGNVQRAVLARELAGKPRLLMVANPCFGLDFAATADIHARLREARSRGAGVLLISEDLDELLALADRLVVMSHGHAALTLPLREGTPPDIAAIGRAMAGESGAGPAPGTSTPATALAQP